MRKLLVFLALITLSACSKGSASPEPALVTTTEAPAETEAVETPESEETAMPTPEETPAPRLSIGEQSEYQTLVWSEEWEDGINPDIWTHEIGYKRNNELQYYSDREQNARTEDGMLILEAHEEDYEGYAYTSGSINTRNKVNFQYGRLEMRAKLPHGKGMWPAFWTWGAEGRWPAGGEIDIMEMIGGAKGGDWVIYVNMHYAVDGEHKEAFRAGNTYKAPNPFHEDFHVFGILWSEESITFYVDDRFKKTIDISGEEWHAFRQPHAILVNLAVGGDWPGAPNKDTTFPQQYIVDWIRYYQ